MGEVSFSVMPRIEQQLLSGWLGLSQQPWVYELRALEHVPTALHFAPIYVYHFTPKAIYGRSFFVHNWRRSLHHRYAKADK